MNNPPAFPVAYSEDQDFHKGMTLRDYFAAKTMQAVLNAFVIRREGPTSSTELAHCAFRSYEMADAMLKAREQ